MRTPLTAALVASLLAGFAGGCGQIYLLVAGAWYDTPLPYSEERVRVVDGDTGRPVPGAEVAFRPGWGWVGPHGDSATADANGLARVRVGGQGTWWAKAPGYMERSVLVLQPADAETGVVRIFRWPEASVRLVLPAGYRGVLRFGEQSPLFAVEDVPDFAPGRRVYDQVVRRPAPDADDIALDVRVLPQLGKGDFGLYLVTRACFADGQTLEVLYERRRDDAVALRRIGTSPSGTVWVVGNDADAQRRARELERREARAATARPVRSPAYTSDRAYWVAGDGGATTTTTGPATTRGRPN